MAVQDIMATDEQRSATKLWHISEESFDPRKTRSLETIYTIGNGYFATRGTFEDNYFRACLAILRWIRLIAPDKAQELLHKLHVTTKILAQWQDVAEHMYIPQDKETGLFEQFNGFCQLEPLDRDKYKGRQASYQAILGLEPTRHYRIIKQADVLAFMTLLHQQFDLKTKQMNWDYYYPITDHDYGSSLTPALDALLACQLGLLDTAYEMFLKGALIDLEGLRGNTSEGIHEACCGAVWQAIVLGFAGLNVTDEGYTTHPCWPPGWTRLAFTFLHKGKPVFVDLRKEQENSGS